MVTGCCIPWPVCRLFGNPARREVQVHAALSPRNGVALAKDQFLAR
jgi:hypothetical protein